MKLEQDQEPKEDAFKTLTEEFRANQDAVAGSRTPEQIKAEVLRKRASLDDETLDKLMRSGG